MSAEVRAVADKLWYKENASERAGRAKQRVNVRGRWDTRYDGCGEKTGGGGENTANADHPEVFQGGSRLRADCGRKINASGFSPDIH